ncbi:DUF421 domain-containing protein [Alicyclobacillus cellulosilyticus]|uniref:DUF421 domain-containing protein n=1 Tax=Alicyclobacillus cellulosilyticus TaxID=1003997 RepID=A0A917KB42_9BACL|nr:DUF421 domain-containing protein [Alicyclobacillus cellulosilyticus]GGJ06130.1 DUF421 domain-containing protein [Alicyclobacillus cellulosilyticus]
MGELAWWEFGIRVVVLYVLVMVALRLMGKREIGQLSIFDFVVSVMIAELSTLPMEQTDVPLWRSVFAIGMLVVLQVAVALLSLRFHTFRHWVEGEPAVLIEHGQVKDREMRKTRYSMHDLLMQLRQKGIADVADVEFAILETSGELSVFPKAEKLPPAAADTGVRVRPQAMPMPLIIDGRPVEKTLAAIGRDVAWLEQQVRHRGFTAIDEVFYATIDEHGALYLDGYDHRDPPDVGAR